MITYTQNFDEPFVRQNQEIGVSVNGVHYILSDVVSTDENKHAKDILSRIVSTNETAYSRCLTILSTDCGSKRKEIYFFDFSQENNTFRIFSILGKYTYCLNCAELSTHGERFCIECDNTETKEQSDQMRYERG